MNSIFSATDITLRDGRAVHIRAIHRSDEDELLQAFERLDAEARYMRFMRVVREPDINRLRKVQMCIRDRFNMIYTVFERNGYDCYECQWIDGW